MGRLTYDSHFSVDFDDRTLAHLQLVIVAKLRRNEAFFLSWRDDPQRAAATRRSCCIRPFP
jgi:hypothetical protein